MAYLKGRLGLQLTGRQWFYAFTLPPQTPNTPVPPRPANTTPNPFHLPPTVAPSGIHPGVPGGRKRAALEDQKAAFDGETGVKKAKTGEVDCCKATTHR